MRNALIKIQMGMGVFLLSAAAIAWGGTVIPGISQASLPSGFSDPSAGCTATAGSYCETWTAQEVLGQVSNFGSLGNENYVGVAAQRLVNSFQSSVGGTNYPFTTYRVPSDGRSDTSGLIMSQRYYTSGTTGTTAPLVTQWVVSGTVH